MWASLLAIALLTAAAGLASGGINTIAPKSEGEKLTVKLWLATAKAKSKKESA